MGAFKLIKTIKWDLLFRKWHNDKMEMFRNMQLFVEVSKASSFRRAAEVLGLNRATLRKKLQQYQITPQ